MIRGDGWLAGALDVSFDITAIINHQDNEFKPYMSPGD
jgi:hypothetical protein